MDDITKKIAVKFVGSARATENLAIAPGTSVRDVLRELKLDASGFQLSDARNLDAVYQADDDLYSRVDDGTMLYASALVIAGEVAA